MDILLRGKHKLKENGINPSLADYVYKYGKRDQFDLNIEKIIKGIPVQYIVGNVNFFGNIIDVNENVLIPRFETEELVSKTVNYIRDYFDKKINIADIGTGSGCIAITLKKKVDANVTAIDISDKALELAKKNAKKNNVNIEFILGNLLNPLNKKYDVIISNPPYISKNEEIMDIVKNNEPSIALYAPNNGLYFYQEILKNASKYLNNKSLIAFEIGYMQGESIKKMALEYFPNSKVSLEKDMQGKDRFIFIFNDENLN